MKKHCSECTRYAASTSGWAPVFNAGDINQETGLCWEVCDMERENNEIENDADSYYAEDY